MNHCPPANYSEAKPVRLLRYANPRLEAASVLLGHLPIQGEAEAKQNKRATPTARNTHDMKPRPPGQAEKALHEATEAVIQSGNTVIEEKLRDAAEAALNGQPKGFLAEITSEKRGGRTGRRRDGGRGDAW